MCLSCRRPWYLDNNIVWVLLENCTVSRQDIVEPYSTSHSPGGSILPGPLFRFPSSLGLDCRPGWTHDPISPSTCSEVAWRFKPAPNSFSRAWASTSHHHAVVSVITCQPAQSLLDLVLIAVWSIDMIYASCLSVPPANAQRFSNNPLMLATMWPPVNVLLEWIIPPSLSLHEDYIGNR